MDFLPLGLKLVGATVLVAGGGDSALRKARLLHRAGARVRLVAPGWREDLRTLVEQGGGECRARPVEAADLDGVRLAVAATDDGAANEALARLADQRGLPVNVVDRPDLSSFVFPALIDRDPLFVAISSSGVSPVLVRRLRARLEAWLPARWGRLARLLGRFRAPLAQRLPARRDREAFWEAQLNGPLEERVLSGHESEAEAGLRQAVDRAAAGPEDAPGEVYLVGAGPGDPDLLTFRALHLLNKADVVLYDRLVAPEVVALARADAEKVYVGKARDRHTLPQDNINDLLVHYARQGKKVCRLKGGDPFIFGRGGEELEKVVAAGIDFQVVPGITAASGCAAYAGIPLTHRDHAQSVRFVTGHRKDGSVDLDWAGLMAPSETLVFYMGLVGLRQICARLIEHGRDPATPIALVSRGTTDLQAVITGTLADLPDTIEGREIHAPTLIIVGSVVSLHPRYRWFH
ncbi:MAG: uroporphyrinogen-III C-methyltransferase [Alcanivorax sp.]|nr:uroporphyrinogen-III C-methyltransferase [Alcanivorax sp.]MAY11824.1 uroporphyrinogen-III C-methyltransferase [Alcanivorax sp.]MBI56270.1 uroporphyrinogen-III C-methyltransferase [Alcanivorax sp.]MBU57890.1 uroporphyrinogen-III C-methyltransferase [Alcanivorax sp.]HCE41455.1 uroporphyrinogen-III C-methyltransferase [Alcanivorax sp.]|tara:strand:+ start:38788 stop:40173 length:1386 start_codon:yes stop_codon:yes gene_type:complete